MISEVASISVVSMGEKVYLPYYVDFNVKSPFNLVELMAANNGGKFDYTMNGIPLDGFVIDIKTTDYTLETQDWKLLQSANNNNLLLIQNR